MVLQIATRMNIGEIAKKLGLSESKHLVRKAAELRRLADVQFNSSIIGVVSCSVALDVHFSSVMTKISPFFFVMLIGILVVL